MPADVNKPVPFPCNDSDTIARISWRRAGIVPIPEDEDEQRKEHNTDMDNANERTQGRGPDDPVKSRAGCRVLLPPTARQP